jgi:ribosomal-protein-alanine N-acetyltransferase
MGEVWRGRVELRAPTEADGPALVAMNLASRGLHHPWVAPPTTAEAYAAYLERSGRPDVCLRLVCRLADGAVLGAVNLSQIVYGPLQSAYMGYYIGAAHAGRGYMAEGVALALDHAFGPLGLHRVEANIQPGNGPSLALARRLGFTREGFSRRYLFIDGDWRDHERFAMLAEEWAELRTKAMDKR